MSYPALSDVESNANQLGVSYWPALAWSALNGVLLVRTDDWLDFQAKINTTWSSWTAPTQTILSTTLPVDIYYAYITDMGAYPPDPNTLLSFAQGAGLVNRLGQLVTLPQVGYGYPPGSGQNTNGTPTQNPNPSSNPTNPPAPGPNPFDFGSFFATLQSDPVTAISTYPGAAAVAGLAAAVVARSFGLKV